MLTSMVEDGKNAEVTQFVNFYGAEGTTGRTVDAINADAYYTQALGQLGLGKKAQARKLLAKVLEMKPDHLWANELMKKL